MLDATNGTPASLPALMGNIVGQNLSGGGVKTTGDNADIACDTDHGERERGVTTDHTADRPGIIYRGERGGDVTTENSVHRLGSACRGNSLRELDLPREITNKSIGNTREIPLAVLARIVFFAISSGLLFGIDLGSIGGAIHGITVELELSTVQVEAVVSGAKGGAIFGCLFGGAMMASQGRRAVVAFASVPFFAGPSLLWLSSSFPHALVGRLLMGLGVGMASVAAPCYIGEVAPPSCRGGLVSLYEIAIALGFLSSTVINLLIESGNDCHGGCWRYMAGAVPLAAAFPLLFAVSLLPESPRWLLSCAGGDAKLLRKTLEAMVSLGYEGAEARLAIIRSMSAGNLANAPPTHSVWTKPQNDLVALWDEHHTAVGSPLLRSEKAAAARPAAIAAPAQVSAARTFVTTVTNAVAVITGAPHVPRGATRGLVLALLAAVLDQACASTSILVYAQHLLKEVGIQSQVVQDSMAIAVACAKFIGVLVGLLIVNRVGRRPLLGWGGVLSTVALVLISSGSAYKNAGILLFGMCFFILVFCATWGNGYWVVVTEVTAAGGPQYGGASQAISTAVLFATGWVTSITFVSVTEVGGPWALLVYAGVGVLMALFAFCLLPEMRGCTLEECAERVNEMPVEVWVGQFTSGKAPETSKTGDVSGQDCVASV